MNERFSFSINASHFAQQIDLATDRAAIADLARRCSEYLRAATGRHFHLRDAPRAFLDALRPPAEPTGNGFLMGIYAAPALDALGARPRLTGVLHFFGSAAGTMPWYVHLLMLEPSARGQGLGVSVHRAFVHWASVRGARFLGLTVSNDNPQAWHFWRDRLGYYEIPTRLPENGGSPRPFRELQFSVRSAGVATPWPVRVPDAHLAA